MTRQIGVCSWSLKPKGPADLVAKVQAAGLSAVQLALDPLRLGDWGLEETRQALDSAGIRILSGMMAMRGEDYRTLESIRRTGGVRPDEHWSANLEAAQRNAQIANGLGLELVTFHAGFLPEERLDPVRRVMIERLRAVVDAFARHGVRIAFETGQERAETLLEVLAELDRPTVGVNFDPANMLLYGMGDPVSALQALTPRVVQVHIKDARSPRTPGTWGEEVTVGSGQVYWPGFFAALDAAALSCALVIERESGADRVGDIRRAHDFIKRYL